MSSSKSTTSDGDQTRTSDKKYSIKGWNWGGVKFDGPMLTFEVDKLPGFEIPLDKVSHCTTGKNEVTIEFHQNDEAAVSLMEMRFHIPSAEVAGAPDPVEEFHDQVMQKASVINVSGDAIAIFREIPCVTPRGRYDIKMFETFFQLHGKTFDYKIPMSTVQRLFLLPHKDGRQKFFVVSVDPPIKQGQTRYHFLILLFNKDDETSVELSMTDRELKEKYEGKLEKDMSGPTYDVLGQIMKVLVQRKITNPGITGVGANNPAIACSHRAGAGLLYPLERGFIYIHKPPVHIRFDEIASINFARSGGSTRSFDFEVETKSGVVHTFSSIEKEEYSKLYDFVTNKKLRVKNTATEQTKQTVEDDLIDSDEEGEPDAYLARVKHEGKVREEEGDSDESDESFNPEADGSGSEGDVAEEFDSNASESSSSEGDSDASSGAERRKKEKKAEKEKKKEKEKAKKASKSKSKEKRTEKKSKKDKDSARPKKPMTAYFLWLNENRERLKKEHPGLSLTELTKKAAEIWRTNVGDKSKWEKQSQEAKKKYEVDMAAYKASGGGSGAGESSKSKSKPSSKSKSSKPDSAKKKNVSPVKSGSFKSKEYISEDDSSSDEDRKPKISKKGGSPSASGSDEEMKSLSSGSASDSD